MTKCCCYSHDCLHLIFSHLSYHLSINLWIACMIYTNVCFIEICCLLPISTLEFLYCELILHLFQGLYTIFFWLLVLFGCYPFVLSFIWASTLSLYVRLKALLQVYSKFSVYSFQKGLNTADASYLSFFIVFNFLSPLNGFY